MSFGGAVIALSVLVITGCATPTPIPSPASDAAATQADAQAAAHSLGDRLFTALQQRRFGDAEATFDDRMRAALPTEKLAAVWNQITGSQGDLVSWKPLAATPVASGLALPYDLTFQRGKLLGQVAVSTSSSPPVVSGLHFLPPK